MPLPWLSVADNEGAIPSSAQCKIRIIIYPYGISTMQQALLTAHIQVKLEAYSGDTLNRVQNTLKEKFGRSHVTLKLEIA
jgi:hypothetical protein